MSRTKATTEPKATARTAVLQFNSRLIKVLETLGEPNKNWPKILVSSLANIRESLTGCHLVQMRNEDSGELYYVTAGSPLLPLKALLAKEEPKTDA